jgi:hypothetical protein
LELTSVADPAWPALEQSITEASNPTEILPAVRHVAEQVIMSLQVTARSSLGAVALHTGGILIDDGWIRVLGSGGERMNRDLATWNALSRPTHRMPGALLVADDAVGGFFAINGGAFEGERGNVFYRAPDSGEWEDMERGYTDFLDWALTGDLERYYAGSRWHTWRADVRSLHCDRAFHVWPPLGIEGPAVDERSRRDVPVDEMWSFIEDFWRKAR